MSRQGPVISQRRTSPGSWSRRRRLVLTALLLGVTMAVLLVAVDENEVGEAGPVARETGAEEGGEPVVRHYRARVLKRYPHDRSSFTQGLVFLDGVLHESSGLHGQSRVRSWNLESGQVLGKRDLASNLFGEGLAAVGDRLIQLTWKSGVALVWDRVTLESLGELSYSGEGWGLCYDGEELVMSDGSDVLAFRDPLDFQVRRTLRVAWEGRPVGLLNELECAEGWVFANILGRDEIARIDPATGKVTALVDAAGLLSPRERQDADVLNGIAYRAETGTFLLTGKLWPALFEVELVPASRQ